MGNDDEMAALLQRARRGIAYLQDAGSEVRPPDLDAEDTWSRARLAHALGQLYQDLLKADVARDASDRDCGTFLFHDGGLAALLQELRAAGHTAGS